MYGNVHNLFIDHVDHNDESKQHHHHGPGDNDILIHKHDGHAKHDHEYIDTDEINTSGNDHYQFYGAADHTHDKSVTAAVVNNPPAVTNDIPTSTHPDNHNTSIEWAGNIYNVTSGFPYKSDPT